MAERVKKRSEIREQDTWKLEDMIASPEKFEGLADGVEERIPGYETYRGKLGSSADLLKSYLEFDESMDETISLLYAYAMQKRDQDTSVSENQALVSRVQSLAVKAMAASSFAQPLTHATAFFQPASSFDFCASCICGVNTRATCQFSRTSSLLFQ